MRHLYSSIDFIEVGTPANDINPPAPPAGAHHKLAPAVIHRIPAAWTLSDGLRSEAQLAGVQSPDAHLDRLKAGPVGGARGIFEDQLDGYVRSMFGRWRTWEETDRARAREKATGSPLPPLPPAERVKGLPAWIRKAVATQVKSEGRDVVALAKNFARTHHIPPNNLDVAVAAQAFEQYLERVRKEAA
jgi:hypothetical protein